MSGPDERYLGDGVYATFDGWFVWLTVDRNGVKERVALEPEVYAALRRYARDVWPNIEEDR
jgi:hypothetical protein